MNKILEKNISYVCNIYIRESGYDIDFNTLKLQLLSHPDYPSFKSISDSFDYFGIKNIVATVPKDAFDQLPDNFLSIVVIDTIKSIVYVKKEKGVVKIYGKHNQKLQVEDFKNKWTGTIIAVEENLKKQKLVPKKQYFASAILVAILLLIIQFYTFNYYFLLLSLSSLTGILISIFVFREEMGFNDETIRKVCSSVNVKGGCSTIIKTPNAKPFGLFSLTDASATFFISQFLILFLLGLNNIFFFFLTLLSSPILIYSIYNQGIILKQWCILCVVIIGICLIEIVIATFNFYFSQIYSLELLYFFKATLLIFIVYFVIVYFKKFLINSVEFKKAEIDFLKFKRNQKLFSLLLSQKKINNNTIIKRENKVLFGSDNSVIQIDAFINPLCGFCVKSFEVYYQLLHTHRNKVNINFIFSTPLEAPDNPSNKIVYKIIDIYNTGDKEKALEAMNDWFKRKELEKWFQKWKTPISNIQITEQLVNHRDWAIINNITYTPTTIINNQYYPTEYVITDLPFLIDELIETKKEAFVA